MIAAGVLLVVVLGLLLVIVGVGTGRLIPEEAITLPTRIVLDTPRPIASVNATITPTLDEQEVGLSLATMTTTPTPTITASPSITPSLTYTPTHTPTQSGAASATPSATSFTATPTPPQSPFPFSQRVNVRALRNNCTYQGFTGTVVDLVSEPIADLLIVVRGPGLPSAGLQVPTQVIPPTQPGEAAISTWEAQVSRVLNTNRYSIQLQDENGAALSPRLDFVFTGTCAENQVVINYTQERIR